MHLPLIIVSFFCILRSADAPASSKQRGADNSFCTDGMEPLHTLNGACGYCSHLEFYDKGADDDDDGDCISLAKDYPGAETCSHNHTFGEYLNQNSSRILLCCVGHCGKMGINGNEGECLCNYTGRGQLCSSCPVGTKNPSTQTAAEGKEVTTQETQVEVSTDPATPEANPTLPPPTEVESTTSEESDAVASSYKMPVGIIILLVVVALVGVMAVVAVIYRRKLRKFATDTWQRVLKYKTKTDRETDDADTSSPLNPEAGDSSQGQRQETSI